MRFTPATRHNKFLRISLFGPSGTGKTLSALQLARGLAGDNGKVAVIDTECGSASLYADLYPFDVAELAPPFTPSNYIEYIEEASHNYDVLIIDSLSHVWDGEGGILAIHDSMGGNPFSSWNKIKPMQASLVKAILYANCHVICALRAKTDWEMVKNDSGREVPKKVGLVPISPKDIEYEFTLVFFLNNLHQASIIKQRTLSFSEKSFNPLWPETRSEVLTVDHGIELRNWLLTGQSYNLESLKMMLDQCAAIDEITAVWRAIQPPLLTSHIQYREIVALFQAAKKSLEVTP